VIYAANVLDSELANGNEMSSRVFDLAQRECSAAVLVSAQVINDMLPCTENSI
jgi:hypothetical protein